MVASANGLQYSFPLLSPFLYPLLYPMDVAMSDDLCIVSMPLRDYYVAVYRKAGQPDRILDGDDGKPRQFPSATAAISAGRLALVFNRPSLQPSEEGMLGVGTWHEDRAASVAAGQIEALGGIIVNGRVVPVERRRR